MFVDKRIAGEMTTGIVSNNNHDNLQVECSKCCQKIDMKWNEKSHSDRKTFDATLVCNCMI